VNIVYPVSLIYTGFGIYNHTSEIHIDLSKYSEIKHPAKTSLFVRENPNSGVFTMIPTTYDSVANELIATTSSFGEIVFGETDDIYSANTPILYEPSIIDTTLNSSFFVMDNLINHTVYFWHVRSILGSEMSEWTEVWSFEATDAFVTMDTPNGGEAWSMGSENVIRWETNITDSVRLDLLYEQQIVRTIVDTTFPNPGAYRWLIPTDLTVDSSYKIIITSITDPSIIDTSDASFSITPPSGVETENLEIPDDYHLFQNYPNPFNPSTKIKFVIPSKLNSVTSNVNITIYDVLGNEIEILIDNEMQTGVYEVEFDATNLPSGIYFYTLRTGIFTNTKKMMLIK